MHSVKPLGVGLVAAAATLIACAASVNTDQSSPVARASPSAPSSLTNQQIDDILQRSHFGLVGKRLQYIWCGWLPRPPPSSVPVPITPVAPGTPHTGTTNGPTTPNEPVPPPPAPSQSGYATWAMYVASHIESGTAFGTDYSQIATEALDATEITDSSGSWCLNGATTSIPERQAVSAADPAQIGSALFVAFAPYDPDTRGRAAHKIGP
jgi:hypothetical protein